MGMGVGGLEGERLSEQHSAQNAAAWTLQGCVCHHVPCVYFSLSLCSVCSVVCKKLLRCGELCLGVDVCVPLSLNRDDEDGTLNDKKWLALLTMQLL